MKPLLLTFDVEEFDFPCELGHALSPRAQVRATEEGLDRLLPVLERLSVPATFFVTGRMALTRPHLVRRLVAAGHEVGAHGLRHRDDYGELPIDRSVAWLRRARHRIEAIAGVRVSGARMPKLRFCPPMALRNAGFAYDATPHPTVMPGRYWGLHWPRHPWREDGIVRVPISVLPWVRLPVSWLWFRTMGPRLGSLAALAAGSGAPYVQLYFHPWEALPLRSFGVPALLARRTGETFVRDIEHLLSVTQGRLLPMTIRSYLAESELVPPAQVRAWREDLHQDGRARERGERALPSSVS